MLKYWQVTLALFLVIFTITFYYLFLRPYSSEQPSHPSAAETTTTPTASNLPPTSSQTENGIESVLSDIVKNFTDSDLENLLDDRYLQSYSEADPIWQNVKGNYYLKSEITSLLGQKANSSHSHSDIYTSTQIDSLLSAKSSTNELSSGLANKADSSHTHNDLYFTETEITSSLADKAASDHDHNDLYFTQDETTALLTQKSDTSHSHNDLYFTENEITSSLALKADSIHTHNDLYFTEAEITSLLAGKSDTSHSHDDRYYTESETDTNIAKGGNTTLLPIQRNYAWIDQMESGWSAFYGGETVSVDTSDYVSGTGAIKVVTTSNGSNSGARKNLGADQNWSGRFVKIHIKADNWDNLQEVRLLISTSGQFVSYFQVNLAPFMTYPSDHNNEWVEFVIPTSSFTTSGTPNWTTVNQLIVRAKGVNGQTPSVWFDEYAGIANPSSGAMLSVVFDDGHSSDYSFARQVLDTYGYKANIFVVPSLLGTASYLTQTQVDFLHDADWEISGHGNTNLTTLSAADAETDVATMQDYLRTRGYRGSEIYAYPNGGINPTVSNIVQKYFSLARTIASHNQPVRYMNPTQLHSRLVHNTDTTTTVNGWIDNAVTNHEWLILTFHRITDGAASTSTEYSETDFQTVIDHAYSSGIEVLPMSQAMRRLTSY